MTLFSVLLLNHAAHEVATSGYRWLAITIVTLQLLLGVGGLGVMIGAMVRDRRR